MIVHELQISKDTVWKIVIENWGGFSCLVPHALTVEQKEDRVAACQDLIEMAVSDAASFKNNVTVDESWCFAYNPVMK